LYELNALIDEIAEAAHEAIETAAGEAARAAFLAGVEREAAAIEQARRWRQEAEARQRALAEARRNGRKNVFIAVMLGVFGGLAAGAGGAVYFMGR